jgi:hypothetical protein
MTLVEKSALEKGRLNSIDRRFHPLAGAKSVEFDIARAQRTLSAVKREGQEFRFLPFPIFMTSEAFDQIAIQFERIHSILKKVIRLFAENESVRAFYSLPPSCLRLLEYRSPKGGAPLYARFDFTFDRNGRPRLYEFNTGAPAGAARMPDLHRATMESDVARSFLDHLEATEVLWPISQRGYFASSLTQVLDGNRQYSFALITGRDAPHTNEFDLIAKQIQESGHRAVLCNAEDLRHRGNHLYYNNSPIDICYHKLRHLPPPVETAFFSSVSSVHDYLIAAAEGHVEIVNGFESHLITENKATLALLWDEKCRHLFNEEERCLIDEFIPETRRLKLLSDIAIEEIIENREHFVLKQCYSMKGDAVYIGSTKSIDAWKATILAATRDIHNDFVVQQFTSPEEISTYLDYYFRSASAYVSYSVFMINGRAAGIVARASGGLITNASQGGTTQLVLRIEDKEAR